MLQGLRLNIIAGYVRPPPKENSTVLVEKLTRCFSALDSDAPVIVTGDFNSRLDRPTDLRTKVLLDTLANSGC